MGGVIFVISAALSENWARALSAKFWESPRAVPVKKGDVLAFWQAGQKRLLGVGTAVADAEKVDYSSTARPWVQDDANTYVSRFRFESMDTTGDWSALTWPELMTVVGQSSRGANSAPVRFDDVASIALLTHLGTSDVTDETPAPSGSSPGAKVAATLGKKFVPRIDLQITEVQYEAVVDPDEWGAGTQAHRTLENLIAAMVEGQGLVARDPAPGGPQYDLAWWLEGDEMVVCEVKSLTVTNESTQIRLGLGQVLDYAFTLHAAGTKAHPWLVVPHEPSSTHWVDLCAVHGVWLCWPTLIAQHWESDFAPSLPIT